MVWEHEKTGKDMWDTVLEWFFFCFSFFFNLLRLLRSTVLFASLPECSAILGVMAGFRVKVNDVKPRFSVYWMWERDPEGEGKRGTVWELDLKQINWVLNSQVSTEINIWKYWRDGVFINIGPRISGWTVNKWEEVIVPKNLGRRVSGQ